MHLLHRVYSLDVPAEVACGVLAAPLAEWLPVIVGHDEDTWRIETREGPIRVPLQIQAGPSWVLPDGTCRRTITAVPDRSSLRYMMVAGLTPTVTGYLRVEPAGTGSRLVFEGHTSRRSRLTSQLERLVLGDPLARSGMSTLFDMIADQLTATARPTPTPPGEPTN